MIFCGGNLVQLILKKWFQIVLLYLFFVMMVLSLNIDVDCMYVGLVFRYYFLFGIGVVFCFVKFFWFYVMCDSIYNSISKFMFVFIEKCMIDIDVFI